MRFVEPIMFTFNENARTNSPLDTSSLFIEETPLIKREESFKTNFSLFGLLGQISSFK